MAQLETTEGIGEDNELLEWLKINKLLSSKQQFIDLDVSMDDLQTIDLRDLDDFIKKDLNLRGIIASRARKAITALQQSQRPKEKEIVRVILSEEEDKIITAIRNKCNQVSIYLNELNNNINKLEIISNKNKNKINEFRKEAINKLNLRMDELINQSENEINIKKRKMNKYIKEIKRYESLLNNAQINCNKLLNDEKLDKNKRKIKIVQINQNINNNNNIMNNQPIFNAFVTVQFNKNKIFTNIKEYGNINNHNYPNTPTFCVKNVTINSATIEFKAMELNVDISIEMNVSNDNEEDEKKTNWNELTRLKNKSIYVCTNLDDNKLYKLRAKCKNNFGWSSYSKIISFKTKKGVIDSLIMTQNEKRIFLGLMKSSGNIVGNKFELLYRATRDGWTNNIFHQKCDNKGKTVCIIYSETNNVFGGFTSKSWTGDTNKWITDTNAFLFLIRSSKNYQPQIFKITDTQYAVFYDKTNHSYMFRFGRGHDIFIHSNCNANNNSSTNKYSYAIPQPHYLNGDQEYFKVQNIEVFKCK